ncbi:MAG: Crp/Fnr family transcriptional regulator [Cyanobacteria bacterium P01_A01_bin.84]
MSEESCIFSNKLLAALSPAKYEYLLSNLEYTPLNLGQILYDAGEPIKQVYFPNQAMISLVSVMKNDVTTEIGLVGNEGLVGLSSLLGSDRSINRSVVQIAGSAMKLDAQLLKNEFIKGEELQRLFLLYTQVRLHQISQIAACNSRHSIEERLVRWLLLVQDCVNQNNLPLKQKIIAQMLGVRRASITEAAIALQKAELIRYSRGQITIINKKKLELAACECYGAIANEWTRLLGQICQNL